MTTYTAIKGFFVQDGLSDGLAVRLAHGEDVKKLTAGVFKAASPFWTPE